MKTSRRLFLWLAALSPLAPALAAAAPSKPVWYIEPREPQNGLERDALNFLDLGPDEANEELYHRLQAWKIARPLGRPGKRPTILDRFHRGSFLLASRLLDQGQLNLQYREMHVLCSDPWETPRSGVWALSLGELLTYELHGRSLLP